MNANDKGRRGLGMILGAALAGTLLAACNASSDSVAVAPLPAPAPIPAPAPSVVVDYLKDAPDTLAWGSAVTLTAFAPAQRSWQYVVRDWIPPRDSHPTSAADAVKAGATCTSCHDGSTAPAPAALGDALVVKDADPVADKVGSRDIAIQAAYTASKFYLKASWQTQYPRPGASHDLLTYVIDAAGQGTWLVTGLEKQVPLANDYDVYSAEDRVSMMFLPGSVTTRDDLIGAPDFHSVGCWASCHNDQSGMAAADFVPTPASKYLLNTRVDGQVGGATLPALDLDALKLALKFPDMWHFRGGRAAAVQSSTDAFVLDARRGDSGTDVFSTNNLDANGNPLWMYDKAVTGFSVVTREQFAADLGNTLPALVVDGPGKNAVPFDPAGTVPGGAILPRRVLKPVESLVDNGGSRTNVKTYSKWEAGTWTVIFERDRETTNPDDHALNPDQQNYSFAFAIHDDNVAGRWHFVSFPVTLGAETSNATIKAKFND